MKMLMVFRMKVIIIDNIPNWAQNLPKRGLELIWQGLEFRVG
jgi:hypothetical protein